MHGVFFKGRDVAIGAYVINYTSRWFSIGFTTSPSLTGHFFGFFISDSAAKRQDQKNGERTKKFRGQLWQLGFWWVKVYLYLYFDGDGLAKAA